MAREASTRDRLAEIQRVRALLDLDAEQLEAIEIVLLIRSRVFCGTDDPMATFIMTLLKRYIWADDAGEGLSIETIESEMEDLRENMRDAISEAYFIANRYPRPVAEDDTPHVDPKN